MDKQIIIFTDLDGTLLDSKNYSYKAARKALNTIKKKKIPLVFCSSKTRAEIEFHRQQLNNHDPFISENGGAVFIPKGYFEFNYPYDKSYEGYNIIELGTPYSDLVNILKKIGEENKIKITEFYDLKVEELSKITALPVVQALLSKLREYDEPFMVEEKDVEIVRQGIESHGLRYTRGGMFHHVTGNNDKGRAVKILANLYRDRFKNIFTIGIGDSFNDIPMLESVDIPVLVQNEDGIHGVILDIPNIVYIQGIGPHGWQKAIEEFVKG